MAILENQAKLNGAFGVDECPIDFSSNLVSTTIISNLTATKTADKKCWVDGPLTYTITIENYSGDIVSGLLLTDYLDPALVTLDGPNAVFIDGVLADTYTFTAGTLSLPLPPLADSGTVTVTFRVVQV